MPDFAPNYSPRWVFRYNHIGQGHTFTVREPRGATVSHVATKTKVAAFLNVLTPRLYSDFAIADCTYYAQDTFIGVPIGVADMDIEVSAVNPSAAVPSSKAFFTRFEAKGNAGGRASLSIFSLHSMSLTSGVGADFRLYGSEDSLIADAIGALSELSPAFVPLGSDTVVWRNYANCGYNRYWVNQIRG